VAEAMKKTAGGAGKDLPATTPVKRTGVVQFIREVYREGYEKVTWPSWKETRLTTFAVFVMVAVMMLFFFFVDFVLSSGESWILRMAG
jgi:preprotein translocase subunit SecE